MRRQTGGCAEFFWNGYTFSWLYHWQRHILGDRINLQTRASKNFQGGAAWKRV